MKSETLLLWLNAMIYFMLYKTLFNRIFCCKLCMRFAYLSISDGYLHFWYVRIPRGKKRGHDIIKKQIVRKKDDRVVRKKVYGNIKRNTQHVTAAFLWFFRQESAGGILLLFCAVVAMLIANSALGTSYEYILHEQVTLGYGTWSLSMSLLHWINDGLMALFFFVVGMEIKREFLFGELKSPSSMLLPIAAAVGGMVVPAVLYSVFNIGRPSLNGWGVPMATDIAFSLGVLAFAAPKAPRSIVVFLTALAIVDDLGGILVIALFYSNELHGPALVAGAVLVAVLGIASRLRMQTAAVYLLGGLGLWYAFLQGGIHPTIAGVLLGFAIPAGTAKTHASSLLARWEHRLTPWSAFLVMPVFALGNAGIALDAGSLQAVVSPVGAGVLAGLFVGKPLGIFGTVYGLLRLRIASMPKGVRLSHFLGAGILGGIGFTMSLFIASLAFVDVQDLMTAKTAVVIASLLSGLTGTLVFRKIR